MSWIVTNWRLKLLALILTIGLLGAVAFSENPPQFATVPVRVQYIHRPEGLVLMSPPTTVAVPVAGLRDDVQRFRQTAAGVTIDLSRAHVGTNQTYWAAPRADVPGVTVRQGAIPVRFSIEPLVTRQLDIAVRTPNKSAGIAVVTDKTYATCGNPSDACQVTVSGPASVIDALDAYVNYDVSITSADSRTSPDEPVQFEEHGRPIALRRDISTIPAIGVTPEVVTVNVTTVGGVQSKTVPVAVRVTGSQPCGYELSTVDVQPLLVTISGPLDVVTRISSVGMDPIPLNGLTATQSFSRMLTTGSSEVTANPAGVTVKVAVDQAFSCGAASPAPGVATIPSPTPQPAPKPSST